MFFGFLRARLLSPNYSLSQISVLCLKAPKEVLQEFAEKVEKKKSVAEDKKRKSQLIDDLIEIDDEDDGGAMMLSRKPMKGPGDREYQGK